MPIIDAGLASGTIPDPVRRPRFWTSPDLPSSAPSTSARIHARPRCCAPYIGRPISIESYQRFMNALKRMRMEIFALKREIEDALYALDPLTGIPGRIGLLSKLREHQALVQRGVRSCCVALMDLDNFKSVNDVYGHPARDKVLVTLAHHIAHRLRPYDRVFHYGGEEFLIVLPDTSLEEAYDIIERLGQEMARLPLEVARAFRCT
jgi:diguanylate cyclase